MEVIIKDTYFNKTFNFDQQEKAFKLNSVLTINKDDAVFKIIGVVNNENIEVEHHFDWDTEVESLVKQAIVKKVALEKMNEYQNFINLFLARNLMEKVWELCDKDFKAMYKEIESWPQDSTTRAAKVDVSETAANVINFIEKINTVLPEDEQVQFVG